VKPTSSAQAHLGRDVGADDRLDPAARILGDDLAEKAGDRDVRSAEVGCQQRPGQRVAAGAFARRPLQLQPGASEDPAAGLGGPGGRAVRLELGAVLDRQHRLMKAERHVLRRLQRELDDVAGEEGPEENLALIAR
jgi:hypothetical protein